MKLRSLSTTLWGLMCQRRGRPSTRGKGQTTRLFAAMHQRDRNPLLCNKRSKTTQQELFYSSSEAITTDEEARSPSEASTNRPYFRIYYNDVYEVHLPPRHRFPMQKYAQVRKQLQSWISQSPPEEQESVQCGTSQISITRSSPTLFLHSQILSLPFILSEFVVSPLPTIEELETTHSPNYIKRFMEGNQTEKEQRNVGFPWSPEGVKRATSTVGGTMAAACSVCEELERQKLHASGLELAPWAAHVAGGTHHAFWDYGEGFSVFSDIAVAANVVLQRYPQLIKKILIVDLDVHQGNGNAVLFQDRPEVTTVSIQCQGNYFSKKQTSDLDIELPIRCNDATYLATVHHWLRRIEKLNGSDHFDLIFFQAGIDILEDDRLGKMNVSLDGVRRRNDLVYEFAHRLNVPLVICMGGGYPRNTDNWKPIIDAHTNVYFQAYQYLAKLAREKAK